MVAEVAESHAAAVVEAAAEGLSAEEAPPGLVKIADWGLEAAGGGGELPDAVEGNIRGDGETAEGSGQTCKVEHMQLKIRRGSTGENASVVKPPDGQHPELLWFWPQVEMGGRQQPYPANDAAGSN